MSKDLTWPTERMAKFIDVTPRRLQQLVQEGIIPRAQGRGRYSPIAVNLAYIRYLRDRATQPEMSHTDFAAEKLSKIRAERRLLDLELAKKNAELAEVPRIIQFCEGIAVIIRNKLIASSLHEDERDEMLLELRKFLDAGTITDQICA